jgi:hypothetical protein
MTTLHALPRIDMGNFPAWLAAGGTVAAVSIALTQVHRDRKQRLRDERIAQSQLISGWIESASFSETTVRLSNRSNEPVYEAVIFIVLIQGAGPRTGEDDRRAILPFATLGSIPPGDWEVDVAAFSRGMSAMPGVELGFTDRTARHWVRRSNGTLQEIPCAAPDHYDRIGRPLNLSNPRRA